jgi:hypothetical protein
MPPNTIDEVIARLTDIVDRARRESSRLGYFAALYRKVTLRVKAGIEQGLFEDGPRMARLDVNFASRYLAAYELHRQGQRPTASWQVAFDAASHWRPLILQQLLLGINAHINLDLGIAAVETSPGAQLAALQNDFDKINLVLASLVKSVRDEIGEVSPWIGLLEKIDPSADDAIINFSLRVARDEAWRFATGLNALDIDQRAAAIAQHDREIAALGQLVYHPPGILFNMGLLAIRLRESNDVAHVIAVLERA